MIQQGYIVVFVLTGAICLLTVASVRGFTNPDVRRGLAGLLVFNGFWSLLTALQLATTDYLLARAVHIGALVFGIATVFAWLVFASAYSGREYHRYRSLQAIGVLIFLSIVAVKVSNPIHGLYFDFSVVSEPFVHVRITYNAIHWFVTGFAYTAASVGFLWLFESFNHNSAGGTGSRPKALYLLVFVTILPIVPYGLSSYSELVIRTNYEPLGVAIFTLGISIYAQAEFTEHSSPSQSTLVDSLSDGGLLVADSGVVINSNERVTEILERSYVPRVPLAELDADLAALDTGETKRIAYEIDGDRRVFEADRSPAEDSPIAADIVTLQDVTRVTRLERLMGIHRDINEALIDASDPWQFVREIPDQFASIDAYEFVWLYPVPDECESDALPESSSWTTPETSFPNDGEHGTVSGGTSAYAQWAVSNADSTAPTLTAARERRHTQRGVSDTNKAWARRLAEHGVTECLAVPIAVTEQRSVVLSVYTTVPMGFDAAERQLIEEICRLIPETARRLTAHQNALRYKEAITQAGTAVFITDTDGTIQYVNPAFERLTGYSEEEAVGATPNILNSGEMSEDHYKHLWETITAGDVFEERITNKKKSGERYIAEQTISPVIGEDSEPIAFVAIQFEVTTRILREQRLSVLHRVLRHNLRTDLNVIKGHATLLEDQLAGSAEPEDVLPKARESLETIRTHATKLTNQSDTAQTIEQALSTDHGGRIYVPIAEIAEKARETARSLGGTCAVTVEEFDGQQVDAEIKQIVEELIENAFVHNDTEPAMADVRLTLKRDDTDLHLIVKDDGPGIPDKELVFIEDEKERPLRHSSGLDMWLVKWLTVSIGGSITASTDDGTTVRVTVPLRRSSSLQKVP